MNVQARFPELPTRLKFLPLDARGFPVPWFVQWVDGKPDFRMVDSSKFSEAVRNRRCWICGERLGRYLAFVIGPMCGVNRTSAEPPCHRECGIFAATACPFLSNPKARRSTRPVPENAKFSDNGLQRNPGVACVWITEIYKCFHAGGDEVLINMGEPVEILWFCEGRKATRAEIIASVESGLPLLEDVAKHEGESAVAMLAGCVQKFMPLVPAE